MLEPNKSEADAARVALLPLECSYEEMHRLLTAELGSSNQFTSRLSTYAVEAMKKVGDTDEQPRVASIGEIAIFSALSSIRVRVANPLPGTDAFEQFPENSSERRMMRYPIKKHPGLSALVRDIRGEYVSDVLYAFQELLADDLQCEFVAVLFAPDSEHQKSTPDQPARTYHLNNESQQKISSRYTNRITKCDGGFNVPAAYISARTFNEPIRSRLHLPSVEDPSPIEQAPNHFVIPDDVVLTALANYAWHGWFRLVRFTNEYYPEESVEALVNETPRIDTEIESTLQNAAPRHAFDPYFGVETENPLSDQTTSDRMSRPDKRLVTVVDTIRSSSNVEFDERISVQTLFDEISRFFPPPERPSNDVSNLFTLRKALNDDSNNAVQYDAESDACKIPAPTVTPFYLGAENHISDQYRHELAKLTGSDLEIPAKPDISPIRPEELHSRHSADYQEAHSTAEKATVVFTEPAAATVETVEPLVNPETIDRLSHDEIQFLTRIGLAMERQIESYSLSESMKSFTETAEQGDLNVNIDDLDDRGLLQEMDTRRTYYSVPWQVRKHLEIPNISNDGFGERAPSENTLHRIGVDLLALHVASQPDVTEVVRYYDMWRLRRTSCWDAVCHLQNKRLDVIGFSNGDPRYVGEIETKSGDKTGVEKTVQKLQAFPDDVHCSFVAPNGTHLKRLMSRLSRCDGFDVEFGASKNGAYRPAIVKEELAAQDILGPYFDDVLTYPNIRSTMSEPADQTNLIRTIIGSI